MAARDGYLRVANENPQFDGMKTVVERDAKGIPIKATCSVWRKDRSHPIECEAYYSEYKKGGNVWSTYPSAMISKVAEVLALKRSFSINGVVTEEEIGSLDTPEETKTRAEKIADAQAVAAEKIAAFKAEPLTIEAVPVKDEPQGQEPPKADWIAPMMKAFEEMKESLGEAGYRSIMTAAGFANKNELMKAGKTKAAGVYKAMKARLTYRQSFAAFVGKHGATAVVEAIGRHGYEDFDAIPSAELDTVYNAVEAGFLGA
jgi:phage host-nuclease inhibitor protein Gam